MHTKPHTHTNALSHIYTLNTLSCTQTHVHSHTNTLTHTHSHTHELSHTVMHTDTHMCTHNLSLSGPAYSPHSSFLVSSPKDTCPPTCPVPKCPAPAHKGIHYVPTLVLSLPVIGAPYVTHTPLYTWAILMKPAGRPTLRNIIQHFISPLLCAWSCHHRPSTRHLLASSLQSSAPQFPPYLQFALISSSACAGLSVMSLL